MLLLLLGCRNKICSPLMNPCLLRGCRSISTLAIPTQKTPTTNLFQCNKRIHELAKLGRITEARSLFDEMIHRDSVTWNSMITGYLQNGRVDDARQLFDAFAGKNVRTWTAMLTGYAKNGRIEDALWIFESMPGRNVVSWNAMVNGFVENGDLRNARCLFDAMPEKNISSWNSIITGYCHCGRMTEAQELFDRFKDRNLVTWMVVISGYLRNNDYKDVWSLFVEMCRTEVRPDQSIFVATLSAIQGLDSFFLIGNIRTIAIKTGYEQDVVVGTALLGSYTKIGFMETAINFFETMEEKNEYSWNTLIAAFSRCGRLDDAILLYKQIDKHSVSTKTTMMTAFSQNGRIHKARCIFNEIEDPNMVTWNAMLAGYTQSGMLKEATEIFHQMPVRHSSSWAAIIAGFAQNGQSEQALELFWELLKSGASPSYSIFTSSLIACGNIGAIEMGRQIHALSIKHGCEFNLFVGNALISMYGKCNNIEGVPQVFATTRRRDASSWNSLITGCLESHTLDDAHNVFANMRKRDVVSWTSIISTHVQAGHGEVSLLLFLDMLDHGMSPNELTITSLLSACGNIGANKLGEQIHALVHKLGFDSHLFVNNALITMYFKCGSEDGFMISEQMSERDIVTWNALLAGCAQNGLGKEAIETFKKMKVAGVSPNEISFLGLLGACSHAGLVDDGHGLFKSMIRDYRIKPLIHHYTCLVDLLGRAGRLSEAEYLIKTMPIEADIVIWEALLAACRIHRNTNLGQKVAEKLIQMGTQNSGAYLLLSNIYSSRGMGNRVEEVQKLMFDRGVSKEPGMSWIQVKNKLHSFLTADKTHNQTERIYLELKELYGRFRTTGYVPDTNFVLHDVEEEQKQNELLHHSEKIAVVFGIMNAPNGSPIRIMKNLRICGDCHAFMKFMSNVTLRKIVVQDGNIFHHFQDGSCSCSDYW